MSILVIFIFGQCFFAVMVFLVLKKLLDRELIKAALEQFESCEIAPHTKKITVYSASRISDEYRAVLESITKSKCGGVNLNFQENALLKGGLVIAIDQLLLDFSLQSRLKHFWS